MRELIEAKKSEYSIQIYSDRLLSLKKRCSEDGAWSQATGEMYFVESISRWVIEYVCPKDGEVFRSWMPEIDEITKQIAKDVLEK